MPTSLAAKCWFLSGATASGKTAVGIALAKRLGAEIISMDSIALYRGMDIGAAKPTAVEQASVPHHLIDAFGPDQEASLAQYLALAEQVAAEIMSRGKGVLFVGGAPLYLKGLLRGIFQGPEADSAFRKTLVERASCEPPGFLHAELAKVDPDAAARLHPNDARRLVRALEVHAKTGTPISRLQRQFETGLPPNSCQVFVLDWPREELHQRIDARVEQMFAAGLVAETRRLLELPRPMSKTARQAVGYREVIEHLEGRCDLETTIDLVKQHTRQLAKRQATWFRSLSECRFVAMAAPCDPGMVTERIVALAGSPGEPAL